MKKAGLIFMMLWVLLMGCWLAVEGAIRIDAEKRPKLIKKGLPVYPEAAKKQGIEGVVELEATITTSGNVVKLKVLPAQPPQPLLEQAAVAAVRQWKYAPYLINGKAKAVIFTVTITFALREKEAAAPLLVAAADRPKKIADVNPVYPPAALEQKIEGVVVVEATTNEKGDVVSARVLPGANPQPLLAEAALTAVRQWKFAPFVKGGKAVSVTFTVTITFKLK